MLMTDFEIYQVLSSALTIPQDCNKKQQNESLLNNKIINSGCLKDYVKLVLYTCLFFQAALFSLCLIQRNPNWNTS